VIEKEIYGVCLMWDVVIVFGESIEKENRVSIPVTIVGGKH